MNPDLFLASAGVCMVMAAIDRFLLQRRKVVITSLEHAEADERHIRFALGFSTQHKLRCSTVSYTLRDKKNPVTVINGKKRPLDFSKRGDNNEYLLFCKKRLKAEGDWVLDVKITSSGSRINPLYKYFPIETVVRKEFHLG